MAKIDEWSPDDSGPEERRQAALAALDLVESGSDREFDAVAAIAARLLDTPFAAITLVGADSVHLKAQIGLGHSAEPRDISFCHWTIRSEELFVVEDAARDPLMARRGTHYGTQPIRFYAGAPIHAPSGERIGSVCVGDREPRALKQGDEACLRELAHIADALIAARAMAREALSLASESERQAEHLRRQERVMQQAERLVSIGSWRVSLADETISWSDNVFRIHGLPVGQPPALEDALDFYPPHARAVVAQALATTIESGTMTDVEVDFLTAQLAPRRIRMLGELECRGGQPVAVVGVLQDVTERWRLEQALRRSADHDELTGIANRAAFNRAFAAAIAAAARDGSALMLALIDLDGFKAMNDTYGHLAGDDVLKAVARRLEQPWLAGSFSARLGGDEFALIVTDAALIAEAPAFAAQLDEALRVTLPGIPMTVGGSVGTAIHQPGDEMRDVFQRADTVLYAVKRARTGERRRGERRMR
jgi:diguanylate cyclase (GGDEF)-like protein